MKRNIDNTESSAKKFKAASVFPDVLTEQQTTIVTKEVAVPTLNRLAIPNDIPPPWLANQTDLQDINSKNSKKQPTSTQRALNQMNSEFVAFYRSLDPGNKNFSRLSDLSQYNLTVNQLCQTLIMFVNNWTKVNTYKLYSKGSVKSRFSNLVTLFRLHLNIDLYSASYTALAKAKDKLANIGAAEEKPGVLFTDPAFNMSMIELRKYIDSHPSFDDSTPKGLLNKLIICKLDSCRCWFIVSS